MRGMGRGVQKGRVGEEMPRQRKTSERPLGRPALRAVEHVPGARHFSTLISANSHNPPELDI